MLVYRRLWMSANNHNIVCHADFAHYRAHLPSVVGSIALKACRRSSLRITKPVKIPLAFKGRAGPKAGSTSESLDCQGYS